MRDRHFMEDENELPYLVWETRDNQQRNDTGTQKTLIHTCVFSSPVMPAHKKPLPYLLRIFHSMNFHHMSTDYL